MSDQFVRIVIGPSSCTLRYNGPPDTDGDDPAFVSLNGPFYSGWTLESLWTDKGHRSKGYATVVLDAAKRWADINSVNLTLWARRFDIEGLTNPELLSFYSKRGFRLTHKVGSTPYFVYIHKDASMTERISL